MTGRTEVVLSHRGLRVLAAACAEVLAVDAEPSTGPSRAEQQALDGILSAAPRTARHVGRAAVEVDDALLPGLRRLVPAVLELVGERELTARTAFTRADLVAAQQELLVALDRAETGQADVGAVAFRPRRGRDYYERQLFRSMRAADDR